MSRDQCVCSDCAQSDEVISKVENTYTITWVDDDYNEVDEDDETAVHEAYNCDECGSTHSDTYEAENCCSKWECNYCGWVFTGSYYSSARDQAAACCVTSCDECNVTGWPDFIAEHTCNSGHGLRRQLPWEARGVVVDGRFPDQGDRWKQTWDLEPENHNVVRAAADYYLLEAMKAGLVGTVDANPERIFSEERNEWVELPKPNTLVAKHTLMQIVINEATEMFWDLVRTWDPILIAYTHMAVGGELRHHQSVGGEVLDSNRDRAWSGWKVIFEQVGTDALTDAAELFHEFGGGSFGGKPWADACLILHKRLTGQIDRALFLDRIFNAQHNGGCLLNKVRWAGDAARYGVTGTNPADGMSVEEMTYQVLPAHGREPEPDYPVLLAYASPAVRALFSDMHEMGRRARLDMGMTLAGIPTKPKTGETQFAARARQLKAAADKQAWEAAQPKSYKYKKNMRQYQTQATAYMGYAESELESSSAAIQEFVVIALWGGDPMPACGIKGCHTCYTAIDGQYQYYLNTAKAYQKEADTAKAKYEAQLAIEAELGTPAIPALDALLSKANDWLWDYEPADYDYDDDACECCSEPF